MGARRNAGYMLSADECRAAALVRAFHPWRSAFVFAFGELRHLVLFAPPTLVLRGQVTIRRAAMKLLRQGQLSAL